MAKFTNPFRADIQDRIKGANIYAENMYNQQKNAFSSQFDAERGALEGALHANSLHEDVELENYTPNLLDKTQQINKAKSGYENLIQIQNEMRARTGQRGKKKGSDIAFAGLGAQVGQDVGNINYDRVKSMDMARSAEEHRVRSGNINREAGAMAAQGALQGINNQISAFNPGFRMSQTIGRRSGREFGESPNSFGGFTRNARSSGGNVYSSGSGSTPQSSSANTGHSTFGDGYINSGAGMGGSIAGTTGAGIGIGFGGGFQGLDSGPGYVRVNPTDNAISQGFKYAGNDRTDQYGRNNNIFRG